MWTGAVGTSCHSFDLAVRQGPCCGSSEPATGDSHVVLLPPALSKVLSKDAVPGKP